MSLSMHEVGLENLDAISGVDSLCLFVGEDERPLRGTAGYVDWRLCGGLSRVVQEGFFTGREGEWLLLPSNGRLSMSRIFVVGVGQGSALGTESLAKTLLGAARTLAKARVESVALEVPAAGRVDESTRAAILVNQFLPEFRGRQVAVISEKSMGRLLASQTKG